MKVRVISHLAWLDELSGEHQLDDPISVGEFIASLRLTWGEDVFVVVNDEIVQEKYLLHDNDRVELYVPLVGG